MRQISQIDDTASNIKWMLYRAVMKLAHRFHWHYAPPIYPEGDTQLWCKWCGFRQTIARARSTDKSEPEKTP